MYMCVFNPWQHIYTGDILVHDYMSSYLPAPFSPWPLNQFLSSALTIWPLPLAVAYFETEHTVKLPGMVPGGNRIEVVIVPDK